MKYKCYSFEYLGLLDMSVKNKGLHTVSNVHFTKYKNTDTYTSAWNYKKYEIFTEID